MRMEPHVRSKTGFCCKIIEREPAAQGCKIIQWEPAAQARGPLTWILALAPFIISGCVTIGQVLSLGEDVPAAPVRQIATTWGNQVVFTPDPVQGGAQTPGMAGRLYLFDARGLPVAGDGSLSIELYDDSA